MVSELFHVRCESNCEVHWLHFEMDFPNFLCYYDIPCFVHIAGQNIHLHRIQRRSKRIQEVSACDRKLEFFPSIQRLGWGWWQEHHQRRVRRKISEDRTWDDFVPTGQHRNQHDHVDTDLVHRSEKSFKIFRTFQILDNLFFSYSDYKIRQRHDLLSRTIGVKIEEADSLSNSNTLMITVTVCMIVFSILEVALYLLYNRVVRKII